MNMDDLEVPAVSETSNMYLNIAMKFPIYIYDLPVFELPEGNLTRRTNKFGV